MMERLTKRIDVQSQVMVAGMLDALDDKLVAMFGRAAVERNADRITVQSKGLDNRRLIDTQMRFLLEGLR